MEKGFSFPSLGRKHSVTRHGCVLALEKEGVVHQSRPPGEAFTAPEVHLSAALPPLVQGRGRAGPARNFLHHFFIFIPSLPTGHFHLQNGSGRRVWRRLKAGMPRFCLPVPPIL